MNGCKSICHKNKVASMECRQKCKDQILAAILHVQSAGTQGNAAHLNSRQYPHVDIEDVPLEAVQQRVEQAGIVCAGGIFDVHHIRLYLHHSSPACAAATTFLSAAVLQVLVQDLAGRLQAASGNARGHDPTNLCRHNKHQRIAARWVSELADMI